MADTLFITPTELAATTILGGNVDVDKYTVNVAFVQIQVIEPLLGTELYDKITADFIADTLTGVYSTIFTEYVQPITKHEAIAEYLEVSNLMVESGGTFIHTAENRQIPTKDDLYTLSGKYHAMAQTFIGRFDKWICKNMGDVPEYKRFQDEVNAQKIEVKSGLYFGRWQQNLNNPLTARDYINKDILNE